MKKHPRAIADLIQAFNKLPGIGPKTAEKFAFWLITQDQNIINSFVNSFKTAKAGIKICSVCFNFSETEPCDICKDSKRNIKKLCIVAFPQEQATIESTNEYDGKYFILGNYLNPLEGIEPADLRTEELLTQIKKTKPTEIILALSPTIEGEATISYLKNTLKPLNLNISRLAQGLPIGASLEYSDQMTLINAISQRKKL